MFNTILTAPIPLFVSLAALAGVTLHDTKVDKLATSFVGIPAITSITDNGSRGIASDPHTHVERINVGDLKVSQPRIMPRADQKKHLMQKNAPKGTHSFDGYVLPLD